MVNNNNFSKYQDRDTCLMDFMEFMKEKQNKNIEIKTI